MIVSEFYIGQGLGNQLFTYLSTISLARRFNHSYGFVGIHKFKGHDIFTLDFGEEISNYPSSKIYEVRFYDKDCGHDLGSRVTDITNKLENSSEDFKLEGLYADPEFWFENIQFVRESLVFNSHFRATLDKTPSKPIIHIRGGDFLESNSSLKIDYYQKALITSGKELNEFFIATDDPDYVRRLFLNEKLNFLPFNRRHSSTAPHHIGGSFVLDFLELIASDYLIISNSTFAFWASLLNERASQIIAPIYWSAHHCNKQHWSPAQFNFRIFTYV